MHEKFLQPGIYAINQQIARPGFIINLDRLEVHRVLFRLLFQVQPNVDYHLYQGNDKHMPHPHHMKNENMEMFFHFARFISSCARDESGREIILEGGGGRAEGWYLDGAGNLPSQEFEIVFESSLNPNDQWHFPIKGLPPLVDPITVCRTIVVDKRYALQENKQIYVERIETGRLDMGGTYSYIKGDFNDILDWDPLTYSNSWEIKMHIDCDGRKASYYYDFNPRDHRFGSNAYIPPGATICDFTIVKPPRSGSSASNVMPVFSETLGITATMGGHTDNDELARLMEAILGDDLEEAEGILIESPHLLSERDFNEATALHHAASAGNVQALRLLIDLGADINAKNISESTPLHFAAAHNHPKTISLLMEHGAELNVKNDAEYTPLDIARLYGCVDAIKELLDYGA
jgi:hypothetical protein